MKAGGPVESGIQRLHNKCLAVDLPNNLGILEVLRGFTEVFQKGCRETSVAHYYLRHFGLASGCQGNFTVLTFAVTNASR